MRTALIVLRVVVVGLCFLAVPICAAMSIAAACLKHLDVAIYLLLFAVVIKREFDEEGGLFR